MATAGLWSPWLNTEHYTTETARWFQSLLAFHSDTLSGKAIDWSI
jgi:hypothetical protein